MSVLADVIPSHLISLDQDVLGDKKKKRKSKTKDKDEGDDEQNLSLVPMDISTPVKSSNGDLLADVQHAKSFVLASSSIPSKMQAAEWPLLLKVFGINTNFANHCTGSNVSFTCF
jgi:hypothetical protein